MANPLDLSEQEIQEWGSEAQALAKLACAHFQVFNDMEAATGRRDRKLFLKAMGTLWRAGEYLRQLRVPPRPDPEEIRGPRNFTERQVATILHGLRLIQCEGHIEGCGGGYCDHFEDYAPLSNEEIDQLCESINFAESLS